MLTTSDHALPQHEGVAVYSVVSRRSGGVSVGIDLNPNHACNWACVYCQVEGLKRGAAPDLDPSQLETLLEHELARVTSPEFLAREVELPEHRRVSSLAFSGNGEPTTSPRFAEAVEIARRVLERRFTSGAVPLVLITNGSLLDRPPVQRAVARLGEVGEVWFKFDRVTDAGMLEVNGVHGSVAAHRARLVACASLAPTWVQTCCVAIDGAPMNELERHAWLDLMNGLVGEGVPLKGVRLYGLARESRQPMAPRLSALPLRWLQGLAQEVKGLEVRFNE